MFVCDKDLIRKLDKLGITAGPTFSDLLNIAPARINPRGKKGNLCILKRVEYRGEHVVLYSVFYQDSDPIVRGDRILDLFQNDENPANALAILLIRGLEKGFFKVIAGKLEYDDSPMKDKKILDKVNYKSPAKFDQEINKKNKEIKKKIRLHPIPNSFIPDEVILKFVDLIRKNENYYDSDKMRITNPGIAYDFYYDIYEFLKSEEAMKYLESEDCKDHLFGRYENCKIESDGRHYALITYITRHDPWD